MQELLVQWNAALDEVFAEANADFQKGRKETHGHYAERVQSFINGLEAKTQEATALGPLDPKMQESITWLAEQSDDFLDRVMSDLEAATANHYRRDPETNPHHTEMMVDFAGQAIERMNFTDVFERQEFALLAAREVISEIVKSPEEPSEAWVTIREWTEDDLTARYESYRPDSHEFNRNNPVGILLRQLQDPAGAADCVARWQPSYGQDIYLEFDPEGNKYSIAKRYQNDALDPLSQRLIDGVAYALEDRYAFLGYPGMNEPTISDNLNRSDAPSVRQAAWKDLQKVFQNQRFLNREHCQEEASALADWIGYVFPAPTAGPADPAELAGSTCGRAWPNDSRPAA